MRCQSRRRTRWVIDGDWPDLIRAAGVVRSRELARRVERVLEIATLHDVEAQQLLLRFCERAVDHNVLTPLAKRRRRGRRHEARDWTEPALLGEPLAHRCKAAEDCIVLLLGPAADDVFRVIAKDGVQHGCYERSGRS